MGTGPHTLQRMASRPTQVPDVSEIVTRVAAHRPRLAVRLGGWQAATALVVHDHRDHGPAFLAIERAVRPGDRWSGHMALPGGRKDPVDLDLAATAARETFEEVGVVVGDPVGRLDDVPGRVAANVVSTFVYTIVDEPTLRPEPAEVASAVWVPVAHLLSPAARSTHRLGIGRFPAVTYDGYTIWGLTYRILENFAATIGPGLP